jgi:hypothetical protein
VWSYAAPAEVTAARLAGAAATLRRVLGDELDSVSVAEAAGIARAMAEAADLPARPLAAAHADLAWPSEPGVVLWHACTILREHRGDAHWAATSAEGLDAVECHVLHAADGAMPADLLQRVSGWDVEAWAAGTDRLRGRGLVGGGSSGGADVVITEAGRGAKLRIEHATDRAAAPSIAAVGIERAERLRSLMGPWVSAIIDAGVVGAWKLREALWRDLPDPA